MAALHCAVKFRAETIKPYRTWFGGCACKRVVMMKSSIAALDPYEIYLHAFHFHESDHRLRKSVSADDPNQVMLIAHPSMMLSAFASELYLKCLLCIETGKVHKGHDLKSLFLRLDLSTRKHLENLWNEDITRPERQKELNYIRQLPEGERLQLDLRYALDIGANAFIELRYFYETKRSFFILQNFPNILQKVIMEKSPPEWRYAPATQPIIRVP
ncbi:MAG TPA: hypothetical protein VIE65_11380 [Methylobacter sp.]